MVNSQIEESLRVEGRLMGEVAAYIRQGQGKLMRPALACLAARALLTSHNREDRIRVATAVELIHTATLLHDDVIDKSQLRRGRQTVNAMWGDDVAILMADYLFATAFDLTLSTLQPEALRIITQATQDMTIGEMYQIETRDRWLTVEDYLRIISAKTARLFGACAGLGALVAGGSSAHVRDFAEFGIQFGLAFQLTDDALDYVAQGERWGKRIGADLAEGKQTLPLLHTLQEASPEDHRLLSACLGNGRDFDTVNRYVAKYGGVEAARSQARDHASRAISHLESAPDSEALGLMRALADYIAEREY